MSDVIVLDATRFIEGGNAQTLPELERAASLCRDVFLAGMHFPSQRARYMTPETMAPISDDPIASLPATAS